MAKIIKKISKGIKTKIKKVTERRTQQKESKIHTAYAQGNIAPTCMANKQNPKTRKNK